MEDMDQQENNLIPQTFTIAGIPHTVEIVDNIENGELYGKTFFGSQKILIATHIKEDDQYITLSKKQQKNTYWHEVFHLFQFYFNNGSDEGLSQTFANFMCEYEKTKS